jgi:hypothetical protein
MDSNGGFINMTKVASFDPSKLLTLYFRIARAGSKKFIFKDAGGDPFDISAIDFELKVKRYKDGEDVFKLDLIDGLTVGGAGLNELTAVVDDLITALDPGTYYWQLYNVTTKKTWLNGDAPFHDGKFDAPNDSEDEIVINPDGETVTITISDAAAASGASQFRGEWDFNAGFPDENGSGEAGAIMAGDEWFMSLDADVNGEPYAAGTFGKAKINTPGQDIANWRLY